MADIRELILKFGGDPRQLRQVLSQIHADLAKFSQGQVVAAQGVAKQTQQSEQRRIADTIKSANQRLREEQKAAREIARITAETARQAAAQERVRERAAKTLADVQIREAKRAAKELEKSLATGRQSGGGGALVSSIAGRIPVVGNLASEFSAVSSAAAGAGPAIAAVAGPIAAVTVGAAALTAGLVAVGAKIFELSKQTAEFQGKFFDLSQQVGISVETLSTLDVVASTTGGSIETIIQSLALFQKNLEESHDPTSKEAKLLQDLGVSSLDTETALRQTIKGLFAMGEGAKQTSATLQLFGRSGRFVNAILKESKGDLGEAAKAFGQQLVVTDQAARMADKFNDELTLLNRTVVAVTAQITSQTIPTFTLLFKELNQALTGNADDWRAWGEVVESQVLGVVATIKAAIQFVAARGTLDFGVLFEGNLKGLIDQARKLRADILIESQMALAQRLAGSSLAGRPGDTPDADKGRKDAQARANKEIQLQQQALEESTRVHREGLERQRRLDLVNIEQWRQRSIDLVHGHQKRQLAILDEELKNVVKYTKDREDLLLAAREIEQRQGKVVTDSLQALQKIEDEAQQQRDDAALREMAALFRLTEAERAGRLEIIKRYAELESVVLQAELDAATQSHAERKSLLEQERDALSTTAKRQKEIRQELELAEVEYSNEFTRLTQERINAIVREGAAKVPSPGGTAPIGGTVVPTETPKVVFDDSVLGKAPPALGVFQVALESLKERMEDFAKFARGTFVGVFDGIAGALAQGVEAWALYGDSIGEAMRKGLAAVLARVAGEATIQALLHGAYALASLAFLDFRGAAQHALVAAQFAAVAAATGFGARAIAGSSNQSSVSQSGGGGGGSGRQVVGPAPASNSQPNSIDIGRNNLQSGRDVIEIRFVGELGELVETKVVERFRGGGRLRNLILNGQEIS